MLATSAGSLGLRKKKPWEARNSVGDGQGQKRLYFGVGERGGVGWVGVIGHGESGDAGMRADGGECVSRRGGEGGVYFDM